MLNSRIVSFILFISLLSFTGCMDTRYNKTQIDNSIKNNLGELLKVLPGIDKTGYNQMPVAEKAKSVEIYLGKFKEKSFEKDNLLEISEFNDSSKHQTALYNTIDGFWQDMYLFKYTFLYLEEGIPTPVTAVAFMPLRFGNKETEPSEYFVGPGPIYWGTIHVALQNKDTAYRYISFDSVLTLNTKEKIYSLERTRRINKSFNLLFIPAEFPDKPLPKTSAVTFNKIIRMDPNRIGGTKAIVFNIPEIFKDSLALKFNYKKTFQLNP